MRWKPWSRTCNAAVLQLRPVAMLEVLNITVDCESSGFEAPTRAWTSARSKAPYGNPIPAAQAPRVPHWTWCPRAHPSQDGRRKL